jgi:hypothetical protein
VADLSLRYLLYGEDKTASKSIKGVGTQASSTASLISGGMSKMGSMIGGEVGDMLNRVSAGFDQIGEKSKGMGAKMVMGGTAVMGLGLAMQTMASKDVAAQQQLDAAVAATGKGYDAFGGQVEALVAKQVAFGHSDDEVKTALRTLTTAYNDPAKALAEMNLVTDLAAAKHISLASAATVVAKAHGGAAKVFKEFGVQVGLNADGTKNYDGALTVLSGKLAGQATASMDTFGGKVQQVKTWLEDQTTTISEKYGPAVTIAGGAVTALGSVMQVMAARSAAAALAAKAETTAVEGSTLAMKGAAIASRAMALASGPVGLALVMLTSVAGMFIKGQMDAKARADDLRASLDKETGAITSQTRELVALQLQQDGTFKLAHELGVSVKTVTDAALGNADALGVLRSAQAAQNSVVTTTIAQTSDQTQKMGLLLGTHNAFATASEKTVTGAKNQSAGFGALLRAVAPINDVLKVQTTDQKELGSATAATVGPTKSLAETQKALKDAADAATKKINDFHQSLIDAGLVVLNQRDAQRQLKQSIQDATDAITKNGHTLNDNTQKGRDNAAALDAVAKNATGMATAVFNSTHSEEAMRQSLLTSRGSLVATAEKFGMNKDAANAYADSVLKIPPHQKTAVELIGDAVAKAHVDALNRKLASIDRNIPIGVNITVNAKTVGSLASTYASQVPHHASGTPNFAGGLTWINEQGPELVSLPAGSAIHTAGETRSMLAGGGSGATLTIENYNEAHQPPHVIAAELAFRLRTA